jgi:hypothetical protein
VTTADNAPDDEVSAGQTPPAQGESGPETEADREREIQRRLTQSGREAAEARRQAQQAQAQLANQTSQIGELQAGVRLLAANLTERDRREAEVRTQQQQAELERLPPADRLARQIQLLQGEVRDLRSAGAQRRPAQQPPSQPQQQQAPPPPREATDDQRREYMDKRVREIVNEAETEFGVRPSLDDIPDAAWDTEETFYREVMRAAARGGQGGTTMAVKKDETPAQMRERIRQEEREKLGATAPNGARPAATRRGKAASADEIRAAAQTYDSKAGPKANIARMQKLRDTMG